MTIQQAFEIALQHYQSGRLEDAESIYRQIIASVPGHGESLHLLACIAHRTGRSEEAIGLLRQAIASSPRYVVAYDTLGIVLKAMGRMEEAMTFHRQAISIAPDYAEAHYNLGNCLSHVRRLDEAVQCYQKSTALRPDFLQAQGNLGIAFHANGQFVEAIIAFRRAIELKSDHPESHFNLGIALKADGQIDEAISAFREAIALRPDFIEAHINLGNTLAENRQWEGAIALLRELNASHPSYAEGYCNLGAVLKTTGQLEAAVAACRHAIFLKPDLAQAHNNLGAALIDTGELDDAIAACRRAIQLRPDYVEALSNLGSALYRQGRVDEAISAYEKALLFNPSSWGANCNLIGTLHAHPHLDATAIRAAHERWNQRYAEPFKSGHQPHSNDRTLERRLRIGYVSQDFREHSVASFIENVLASHDGAQLEIFCYSSVIRADAVTGRLQRTGAHWRDIVRLQDSEVAALVRRDCIDILVDLSGHTAGHRLMVFARKPAPIQVTWLGYPGSTGLGAMDYRLTDAFADPPGTTEHLHSEQLVRLPDCAWCYRPATDAPSIVAPPSASTGHVTFGSFNAQYKINPPLLKLWSDILLAVPRSRLLLKNDSLNDHSTQERIRTAFKTSGIASDRIELAGRIPILRDHLAAYSRIDIALDTFPYHGTTTTCEALWMGVPVVSRAGKTHVCRVGVSLLNSVGLPELIATDETDYIRVATELAADPSRLAELRAGLRVQMASSVLADATGFTRKVERAYRAMWRKWCAA